MSRITKYTRDAIASSAIAFAFDPKEKALKQIEHELAREVHAYLFPKDIIHIARSLPKGWIRHISTLKLNAAGHAIDVAAGEELPVPATDKNGNTAGSYGYLTGAIPPGDLADRLQGHAQVKEKLRDERKSARRQLDAMLAEITTIKKLAEAWPEGEPFYSKYLEREAPQVPALRVDEINEMLGLPIEEAA
ncbi:Nmad5 family putative nucleotide modification protein [Brucella sp. IR073]|uniref:Nmad5 family putative nucleotide modification protein n=1 Tax=unclassified Brucella TaxID=2632610 RepID=UPI003B97FFD5